ncbi:MAG: AraC family transcriptional regulator [Exiguobacterium acetylicum]
MTEALNTFRVRKHALQTGGQLAIRPSLIVVIQGAGITYTERKRLEAGEACFVKKSGERFIVQEGHCLLYQLDVELTPFPIFRQPTNELVECLERMHRCPKTMTGSLRQHRYLYQLLEQLSERRQEQTFEEVTSQWLEELGKSRTVSDLASELNMSLPTFSRQFKKHYDQSPKELIHQLRMQRAKEWMIAHPDWTIAEIAERVSINDEFYFSRLFKKREGLSPSQYRKRLIPRVGIWSQALLQDHLLALGIQPVIAPSFPTQYRSNGVPDYLSEIEGTRLYDASATILPEWFETSNLDLVLRTPIRGELPPMLTSCPVIDILKQTCWKDYLYAVATATDMLERATDIINEVETFESVVKQQFEFDRNVTWAVIWIRDSEIRLYGRTGHTMLDFLFNEIGLRAVEGLPQTVYMTISLEILQQLDPDGLFILWSQPADVERIRGTKEWKTLRAVRTGRIFHPDSVDWDPWGPLGRMHMLRQLHTYISDSNYFVCP